MKYLLSLIIPVFKAEDFIEACLVSVFSQLPDEVEVILINDGTPDNSIEIVRREFPERIDSGQLVLLEQSNLGPDAARNAGTRKSQGQFIAFLDSDDVLLDGYFKEIFNLLNTEELDIIEFGYTRFVDELAISKAPYRPLYSFNGLQKLCDLREDVFAVGVWFPSTRIYRSEIFQRFSFPENTHYENWMLLSSIYMLDLDIYFMNKPLLGYRYNPASITSNHTLKQFHEIYGFYKSISGNAVSESTKILKLKVARSIVFFFSEMKIPSFSLKELILDMSKLRLSPETRAKLRRADRIFLHYPSLYVALDALCVSVKKMLLKAEAY